MVKLREPGGKATEKNNFIQNRAFVINHNANRVNGIHNFDIDLTSYADMTNGEFRIQRQIYFTTITKHFLQTIHKASERLDMDFCHHYRLQGLWSRSCFDSF